MEELPQLGQALHDWRARRTTSETMKIDKKSLISTGFGVY
jgi:hypothetical protein